MAFWQRKWKKATAFTTRGPIYSLLVFTNICYHSKSILYENYTYFRHVVFCEFCYNFKSLMAFGKAVEKDHRESPIYSLLVFTNFTTCLKSQQNQHFIQLKFFSKFFVSLNSWWHFDKESRKKPTHSQDPYLQHIDYC